MLLQNVVLYFVCISCALRQVWFAIYDMTTYYWDALVFYLKAAISSFITFHFQATRESLSSCSLVIRNYLRSIPSHFWVHFMHCLFLHKLGFENNEELTDVGSIVWRENEYGIKPATSSSQNLLTKANPKYISGLVGNKSGNPSHLSSSSFAIDAMWFGLKDKIGLNLSTMVFIDFGCGTGLAILAATMQPFSKVIGVELDSVSADMCRKNVETFKVNKPELILSTSTEIYTKNMIDFEYPKDAAIVMYMYEPLWNLSKVDAHDIYVEVLSKAIESAKNLTVVYFPCTPWNGDAMKALTKLGGRLLLKVTVGPSLIFDSNDYMYIFQFDSR